MAKIDKTKEAQRVDYIITLSEHHLNRWCEAQIFLLDMPWWIQLFYGRKIRKFIATQNGIKVSKA